MKKRQLTKKQLTSIIVPSSILGLGGLATGIYFIADKIENDKQARYFNEITSIINNFDKKVSNDFVKGADVSSYAEIVENLLFQNNIKKADGTWYTYKDIANPNNKVWDDKAKKNVSLEEYINNNLYSYFDDDSNRIFDNMFAILKKKGITTLRLRFWVDPYDKNGNSYGGGHNDLDTNIFIMQQAKKYGFDDFLVVFHYSDFWADPFKHYIPKAWENKTNDELLKINYDYTTNVLERIYNEVGIIPNKVQYGNEVSKGFLDTYDENKKTLISKSFDFLNDFIIAGLNATDDFLKDHPGVKIDKNIHIEGSNYYKTLMKFEKATRLCDSIQFSFYMLYDYELNWLPKQFELIRQEFPNQKLYMGELSLVFSSQENQNINQGTQGNGINANWDPEIQALVTFQHMQLLSKLLPDIETGCYWWEIGQLYIGRFSWATKEGIEYFKGEDYKEKNFQDVNDWSSNICFDKNGIALPVLDVFKDFERNPELSEWNIYEPNSYFELDSYGNLTKTDFNFFVKQIKFLWRKDFIKKDLSKMFYDKKGASAEVQDIDLEIYLNNKKTTIDENLVIKKIKEEYISLMYNQIDFSDFSYDENTKIGQIKLSGSENSFYYKNDSSIILKFKVFPEYLTNTIDLTSNTINISKTDNLWYKKIISFLKNQKTTGDFGTQIWDYLNIKGGGTDDDNIWLYDENKQVNRDAEFFLLSTDKIRRSSNKVDYDILKEQKFWIDNFKNYKTGIHDVYFAIRKAVHEINWEYDTKSTFSEIGAESWKYTDILIYKLKINVME